MGLRIVAVANISSSSHKIAIISQCPKCKKFFGVVTGDTDPIPYRADSVELSGEMEKKIPLIICQNCSGPSAEHYVYPESAPQHQTQTTV